MAIPPKPRVRGSKNRKKAWKKTDITEVEEYLEEKRFDERIGGTVSEKKDADLFIVQTTAEDGPEVKNIIKGPLKCHSNIGVFSKVPVPISIDKEPYSKKIIRVKQNAEKRRRKVAQLKAKKLGKKELKEKDDKLLLKGDLFAAEVKDIWGEEEKIDPEIRDLVLYRDEYTKKRGPKVPFHLYQKPSLLPAVEVPHPGASYNPAFEDHQDLLSEAVEIEEVKQKGELHLKRVLTDMFPTKANAPTQESILAEMSQGLFEDETIENVEVLLSQHRNPAITPDDRIPKSKKRRKKERKEQERLKKVEKLRKKQLNEVYRLRSIKSELKEEESISEQRQDKRLQEKIDKMYKPLTLSKHKFEAPDLEVALPEELCDSLRTLKSEGNLLEDRYKSLQKRNLIEPRIRQKRKRKYKLKVQVKRNHRDFQ
ncbi:ribosome biogenesis protein NOP53 [Parasteatoda tepidariorum]|uniref:ribosome biogenesis protein NOP53 n=1 Tax=Parasteatoda tepidariorum TaxID=114398 RepID=UPI00077FB29A|nr:ribosome biogenesis protein NOP53 [Parasteatoda tepidariorum]